MYTITGFFLPMCMIAVAADQIPNAESAVGEDSFRQYFQKKGSDLGFSTEDIPYGLAGLASKDETVRVQSIIALGSAKRADKATQEQVANALSARINDSNETPTVKRTCLSTMLKLDTQSLKKHVTDFKQVFAAQIQSGTNAFAHEDGERLLAAALLLLRWGNFDDALKFLSETRDWPIESYAVSGALAAYIAETGGMKDHTVAQRADARKLLFRLLESPLPKTREHVLNAIPYMLRPGMEEWPDQRTANKEIKTALDARIGHEDDDRIARTILELLEWFEIGDASGHFGKLPTEEAKAAPKK